MIMLGPNEDVNVITGWRQSAVQPGHDHEHWKAAQAIGTQPALKGQLKADRGEQPPHDVLAPLVDSDLYQRPLSCLLDHPELVSAGDPVLEFDPGEQPP